MPAALALDLALSWLELTLSALLPTFFFRLAFFLRVFFFAFFLFAVFLLGSASAVFRVVFFDFLSGTAASAAWHSARVNV